MFIMQVILEKIIYFLCHGTPNMTSKWLLWSPIIKEHYLIHYSPLKNIRCIQRVQFKDHSWRHPDADFVIWVAGGHLGFTQNGVLRCYKIWTPWFYHSFVSIDISTLTEFGDTNLANSISVTCQPPPVTAHMQCHVNSQNQGTGLFVIKQMANRPIY